MPWDAGSIVGKLKLDNSEMTHSILEAEGIMRLFPASVSAFMADPLLGLMEVGREVAETLKEAFKEIVNDAESANLESLKLGVDPEFFSVWEKIGHTVNIGTQQLDAGLRFMQLHAQQAIEGDKSAIKTYGDLGISMSELAQHQTNAGELWELVRQRLDALPNSQERIHAAQELLSKSGGALLPLLLMQRDHFEELADTLKGFGDTVDQTEARSGQKIIDLLEVVNWAWGGIGKAAEKPVFDYFANHADELRGKVRTITGSVIDDINKVWGWIEGPQGKAAINWLETEGTNAWHFMRDEVGKLWGEINGPAGRAAIAEVRKDFNELFDLGKKWTDELIQNLPTIIADMGKLADETAHVVDDLAKNVGFAAEAGMTPQDFGHSTMTLPDWLGGSGGDGANQQTEHHGPQTFPDVDRAKKDALIFKEFHQHIPKDWPDELVNKTYQRALDRESGAYNAFPGHHDENAPAASAPFGPASPLENWAEEQRLMNRISSGRERGEQLDADLKRYHELTAQDFERAKGAGGSASSVLHDASPLGPPAPANEPTTINLSMPIDSRRTADELLAELKPHLISALAHHREVTRLAVRGAAQVALNSLNIAASIGGFP